MQKILALKPLLFCVSTPAEGPQLRGEIRALYQKSTHLNGKAACA